MHAPRAPQPGARQLLGRCARMQAQRPRVAVAWIRLHRWPPRRAHKPRAGRAGRAPCRAPCSKAARTRPTLGAPLTPVRTRGHACRRGAKNLVPLRRDPAAHRARGGVSAHLRVLLANASLANKRQNFPSVTFRLPQKQFVFPPSPLPPLLALLNLIIRTSRAGVGRR